MKQQLKKTVVIFMAVCMMVFMGIPAKNADAVDIGNEKVKEASKGVVQVLVTYTDETSTEYIIQSGSGFFIGSEKGADTIVTNHHVVTMDDEMRNAAKEVFGRDIINDISIKIVVDRDLTTTATLTEVNSAEYDVAVLKLESPLSGFNILSFASDEPQKTQMVYALGFPDVPQIVKDKHFYTSDDVTITSGTISDMPEVGQTKHIQHECQLSSGNSGGPLVNENGEVVGVNRAGVNEQYYYSIEGSELTKLLDRMNIEYMTGGSNKELVNPDEKTDEETTVDKSALEAAISSAQEKLDDGTAYTDDSRSFLEAAIEDAQTVVSSEDATQERVDAAAADVNEAAASLEEDTRLPMGMIIGIVAAVVVVIILIIVIVLISGKKKKKAAANIIGEVPGPGPIPGPIPSAGPAGAASGSMTPPHVPSGFDMGGSDETSVLNEGAGQTTVLSAHAVPAATLKRNSNGETAIINKAVYRIGKEKSKVDFCVSNNSSVSRVHAEIVYENGAFYITDQNATNFTFVNGNKVNPGQKVKLNNGDKIKLSDEEFEFKA